MHKLYSLNSVKRRNRIFNKHRHRHSITHARIQGGGQGGLGPPSPQNIAPPNSKARIQGGQEGLAPPPPGAKRALAPPLQNPGSAYVTDIRLAVPKHRLLVYHSIASHTHPRKGVYNYIRRSKTIRLYSTSGQDIIIISPGRQ